MPSPNSQPQDRLGPYVYISTSVIILLGILGGYSGNAWPWVLGIFLLRIPINIILNYLRKQGTYTKVTIIAALVNYSATVATILLTGGSPNPFWLLFLVESLASGIYRAASGIILFSITAFFLLFSTQIINGFDLIIFINGCIYSILAFLTGMVANQAVTSFYQERADREKVEEQIRLSEQRLRQVTDNMLDLIAQIDPRGVFDYLSPSFQNILGHDPAALLGRSFFEYIHPEDAEGSHAVSEKLFAAAQPEKFEVRFRHAAGHYLWFEWIGKPSIEGDRIGGVILSGRDITERRRMEEQVRASLLEKEVLLKEIHHRVKNNLQVISSLLYLQSQNFPDQASINAFHESQDRVRTMALIHEKLYQSENLAEIEFSQYITNLAHSLLRSYGANAAKIRLNIQCDPLYLDIDTSMPCGLIVNELVSNALKYAFKDREPGEIRIELRKTETGQVTLIVADNGTGFPPNCDPLNSPSLGLQLVNSLVGQLDGTVRFENDPGVYVEIGFQSQHQR